jgi:hypothetical protein
LARIAQFATAAGIPANTMRAATLYHAYISGTNWDITAIGPAKFAIDNGLLGVMINQGIPNYDTWASGGYDANFLAYLKTITRVSTPARQFKCVPIFQHEPENDANSVADAPKWCQGTARFMKIAYEYGDPNIIYSTCHIPAAAGHDRSLWNPRPALNALYGGDTVKAAAVMAWTLCGLDPYPEVDNNGTVQTIAGRTAAALTQMRSWGYKRFSWPEWALFNFKVGGGIGPLDAVGQANRIRTEGNYAKTQNVQVGCYFDVTDVNNARGDSRTLETAQEQAMMAKLILNQAL